MAEDLGNAQVEKIILQVETSAEGLDSPGSGLNVALSQLNALEASIKRVEASYDALMASMRRSTVSSSGNDPSFLGQQRLFDQRQEQIEQAARRQGGSAINLDVPAAQISAFVSGQINLIVHGEQIRATVAGTIPLIPGGPAGGGGGHSGGGGTGGGLGAGSGAGGANRILLSTRVQGGRTTQRYLIGEAPRPGEAAPGVNPTGHRIETVQTELLPGGTTRTTTTTDTLEKRDPLQRGTFRTSQEQASRARRADSLRRDRGEQRRLSESGFLPPRAPGSASGSGGRIAPGFTVKGAVDQQRDFNRYIDESRRAHERAEKAALKHDEANRFIGKNMLRNIAHVTAWAAAVAVLYGSLNLLTSGLGKMVEIQFQTARLTQVLRSEWETSATAARKLTDDVLRLAGANGRGSKEAMDSAVQWSRLGFQRAQVAEAVRVSLVAANVAEITAAEATNHLSSLTQVYGLRISELNGVLGMLNNTSNTYNVTNKDLLSGLTRTAAVAKQAGIPLAELIGYLGAGVGATGQTGANIGNAIKSITGAMSNKDVQKMLREDFKIEVTSHGGEGIKEMPQILADIFVAYQKMNEAERQSMIYSVAGKNQASRMAALLDNYVRSQVLAINAQLNLNSAEQENILIKGTLKSQLMALATEWDRFVNLQGNQRFGPSTVLTEFSKALTNLLRLANTGVGSALSTGLIALFTVLGAKLALTAIQMARVSQSRGMTVNTLRAVGDAARNLNTVMQQGIGRSAGWVQALAGTKNAGSEVAVAAAKAAKATDTAASSAGRAGRAFTFLRGSFALAAGAFVEALPAMLIIAGVIEGLNIGMEKLGFTSKGAESAISKLTQDAERAGSASEASGMAARLFKTTKEAIGNNPTIKGKVALATTAAEAAYPNLQGAEKDQKVKLLQQELKLLIEQGRVQEYNAKFDKLAAEALVEKASKRAEQYEKISYENAIYEREISRLEATPFKHTKRIEELRAQIRGNQDKRTGMALEDMTPDNSLEEYERTSDRHKAFLGQQKGVIASIADLYKQMPGDLNSDKLDAELRSQMNIRDVLQQQLDIVEAKMKAENIPAEAASEKEITELRSQLHEQSVGIGKQFEKDTGLMQDESGHIGMFNSGPDFPISEDALRRAGFEKGGDKTGVASAARKALKAYDDLAPLKEQIAKLEEEKAEIATNDHKKELMAQRKAIKTDLDKTIEGIAEHSGYGVTKIAETADQRAAAIRLATATSRSFGVGDGAGQQFVSTIRGTQDDLAKKEREAFSAPPGDNRANLQVQALQHRVQLTEMLIHGEEMLKDLGKDELNLLIAKNREYQRQTLTMGPAELLRRMAVNQLGAKGFKAGQFFALDAGARADFLQRPENTEEVLENRRSQRALRGYGFGKRTDQQIGEEYARSATDRNTLRDSIRMQNPNPIDFRETYKAAAAMNTVSVAAIKLAGQFEGLAERISFIQVPVPVASAIQKP